MKDEKRSRLRRSSPVLSNVEVLELCTLYFVFGMSDQSTKIKVQRSFCLACLLLVARTRPQTEGPFDLAQPLRHAQSLFRTCVRAVDCIFTVSHQRFKLVPVDA